MVMKVCKICGNEFDARGRAKCCSPECSKINKNNINKKYLQSNKGKVASKKAINKYKQSDKGKVAQKKANEKYYNNHRNEILEYQKEYRENHRDERREYKKEWYRNNRDKILEYQKEYDKEYIQNKIAELNKRYDGDLELILKDCPTAWLIREAIMQVEYGVSYAEAMYKKMELNPVCEVTGESNDLVIHHLDSFNLYPEKGADLDNLIRVTKEVHKAFHSQFGWGNNTRDQWEIFVKGYGD